MEIITHNYCFYPFGFEKSLNIRNSLLKKRNTSWCIHQIFDSRFRLNGVMVDTIVVIKLQAYPYDVTNL